MRWGVRPTRRKATTPPNEANAQRQQDSWQPWHSGTGDPWGQEAPRGSNSTDRCQAREWNQPEGAGGSRAWSSWEASPPPGLEDEDAGGWFVPSATPNATPWPSIDPTPPPARQGGPEGGQGDPTKGDPAAEEPQHTGSEGENHDGELLEILHKLSELAQEIERLGEMVVRFRNGRRHNPGATQW